jgi:AraC family transcriptional regulator
MQISTNERLAGATARTSPAAPKWPPLWPAANAGNGTAAAATCGNGPQQLHIDITPVEQVLRQTRSVALGRYRCPVDHPQFNAGGGPHTCSYISFHRTSVRMRIGDARPEVATPNHASFYNVGEQYTREAIGDEGDECDWIALSPALLREAHAELAEAEAAGGRLFPRPLAPMKPQTFLAQRRLFAAASSSTAPLNSLQIDEAVAALVDAVVAQALDFWGCSGRSRRRPRPVCHRRRLQIVEDAKALLAREYWSDLSLADLAHRLHCSAAHLSRLFHAVTGYKLCDYRQELRLRKGLFLLEETGLEIGDIAVQVGFASHSHFTSAFHRRFGINPSTFARWKSHKVLRAMANCA